MCPKIREHYFYMISDATQGGNNLAAVANVGYKKANGDSYKV